MCEDRCAGVRTCSQVCFGLLRMGFGKGQFRRSKWIYVKFSGERVPALKRGLANANDASMRQV
jgi:hypothetical protein